MIFRPTTHGVFALPTRIPAVGKTRKKRFRMTSETIMTTLIFSGLGIVLGLVWVLGGGH